MPIAEGVPAETIVAALRGAGATHVVIVPDTNQKTVLDLLDEQPDLPVIRCAAEDDVFGVCTGLWFAGHRPDRRHPAARDLRRGQRAARHGP